MMENILFIINPVAGTRTKQDIPSIIKKELGSQYKFKIVNTLRAGHASELVKENIKSYKYFVAVGGDGTVNEVASALVNTDGVLGIIPLGSGNGLARHLNVPLNIRKAVKVFNGKFDIERIDTCEVNDIPYFMTSGVGFEAEIAKRFSIADGRGFYTYFKSSVKALKNYSPRIFNIEVDGKKFEVKALTLSAANSSQYGNNTFINPLADVQDGLLDLCILEPIPWYVSLGVLRRMFTKSIHKSSYYQLIRGKHITVKGDTEVFHFDGECTTNQRKDLEFKLIPSSLNVMILGS